LTVIASAVTPVQMQSIFDRLLTVPCLERDRQCGYSHSDAVNI